MPKTPKTERKRNPELRDQMVYEYVREQIAKENHTPTFREIANALGFSNPGTALTIHRLVEKGLITFEKGMARSIRLTEPPEKVEAKLPLRKGGFFGPELELVDFSEVFQAGSYCEERDYGEPGEFVIYNRLGVEQGTLRKV
jgi:SOS-response transcriptional repressor LexA